MEATTTDPLAKLMALADKGTPLPRHYAVMALPDVFAKFRACDLAATLRTADPKLRRQLIERLKAERPKLID